LPAIRELAEAVSYEASFLRFVSALRADREAAADGDMGPSGTGALGWQNHTIEAFLEAAQAWAEDSDFGRRVQLVDVSPWKRFAPFLYCGKIHE
jgi:hypothetical protein